MYRALGINKELVVNILFVWRGLENYLWEHHQCFTEIYCLWSYISSVENKIQLLVVCARNIYVWKDFCITTWRNSLSDMMVGAFRSVATCMCACVHVVVLTVSSQGLHVHRVCLVWSYGNQAMDTPECDFSRQIEITNNLELWQHSLLFALKPTGKPLCVQSLGIDSDVKKLGKVLRTLKKLVHFTNNKTTRNCSVFLESRYPPNLCSMATITSIKRSMFL